MPIVSALLVSAGPVSASDWWPYDNARFGYEIELPAEFGLAARPDNNDGLTLAPPDKSARLLVFGTHMFDGNFATEAKIRMSLAKGDGWQISYSKTTSRGMSFSGIRQDRIVYVRGVALCNGGAAFFQMDYPKAAMQRYDAVVMRLVRSLHPTEKCTSSTQLTKGFPATG
ncbi:hypothetical protein CPY51_02535 [Rhizobium tubonense]|uniref:Uncharacterized protein n=1 Tax=Rhizobium tubonense TaxID=484088 RepID=A0A2W4D3H5_9HYPH|nr:hypothetical protein CPY51_02535 [Rhizobium tubonense]